jgi:hypothetical protein
VPRKPPPPVVREPYLDTLDREVLAAEVLKLMEQFEEMSVLDPATLCALGSALAKAIRFARMPWPVKRSDVSGLEYKQQVLAFEVAEAMRMADLPVRSWRQDTVARDPKRGEALYYRVLRATAADSPKSRFCLTAHLSPRHMPQRCSGLPRAFCKAGASKGAGRDSTAFVASSATAFRI